MNCPICGEKAEERRWHDEVFGAPTLVEELIRCPRGHYAYHYSYGSYEVTVGARRFGWRHDTPDAEQVAIEAQVDDAVAAAKKRATPVPPKRPVLTDTGERIEGLPVCRLGNPAQWSARQRRDAAVRALIACVSRGETPTLAQTDEAYLATCEVFRLDGRRFPKNMHSHAADPVKSARDALVRDLMRHTLADVAEDRGGWASDRFEAIHRFDWDLAESNPDHRPFLWACYRARLEANGKPATFRPAGSGGAR